MEMMQIESIVLSAAITIFSLGLLLVSLASYRKYKNLKLLLISVVFIIFLVKGILLSLSLFYQELSTLDILLHGTYSGVFDLMVLLILFMATLKR